MYHHGMSDKLDVDDLTQTPEESRTFTVDVKLTSAQRAQFQKEADARGMLLEDYMRGMLLTAAAITNAGGSSSSGSGAA